MASPDPRVVARAVASSDAATGQPVQRFGHVLRSEFLRIRTLRSSWIGLGAAALLPVLLTVGDVLTADDPSRIDLASRVAQSLLPSLVVAVAVASTFVTAEFATGMIRITYANTPQRRRAVDARVLASVVYAVAVVWSCAVLAGCVGAVLVALRGGSPTFSTGGLVSFGLVGLVAALYLLIGDGVAFLWRSTPAVSSFVAIYPFVENLLVDVLRQTRWNAIAQWFPFSSGWDAAMDAAAPPGIDVAYLGRPWGLLYLMAWSAVLMFVARSRELRGDE